MLMISSEQIKTLSDFLQVKIDAGYYTFHNTNSYLYQVVRILKYLFVQLKVKKKLGSSITHVSLPYFVTDAIDFPKNIISIRHLSVGIKEIPEILFFFLSSISIVRNNIYNNRALVLGSLVIGYIYYLGAKRSAVKEVHFHYYSFVPDVVSFLYFCSLDTSIKACYYEYMGFLDSTSAMICNEVIHKNNLASIYAQDRPDLFQCSRYRVLEKNDNNNILNPNNCTSSHHKTIGIYSSGFYARLKNKEIDESWLIQGLNAEKNMCRMIYGLSKRRPDLKFKMYLHLRRGVETFDSANEEFKFMLDSDNIELINSNKTSSTDFINVNLGITVISNVFWDRLHSDMKTVLFDPFLTKDFIVNTNLNEVAYWSESNKLENFEDFIDKFANMPNHEFKTMLF